MKSKPYLGIFATRTMMIVTARLMRMIPAQAARLIATAQITYAVLKDYALNASQMLTVPKLSPSARVTVAAYVNPTMTVKTHLLATPLMDDAAPARPTQWMMAPVPQVKSVTN